MAAVKLTNFHRHPLNRKESFSGKGSRLCGFCGEDLHGEVYECSQCNFTAHIGCAENPPSLVIDASKIHEHPLTLLTSPVSFTCNACGMLGERSPYICLLCSFLIHKDCLGLPRVININRHDHRIGHTWFLGPGKWVCRVCHQMIDWQHGAYSCRICNDYTVHSRCATRDDVWDGVELEGTAEEDDKIEDMKSFRVLDETLIAHISHQHTLRLEDGNDVHAENVHCSACAFPIASDPFYRCGDLCDFFLHKKCANLPLKKRKALVHVHPLTLCTDDKEDDGSNSLSRCDACDLHFNGFRYRCLGCKDDQIEFDTRCSSVLEPFKYHLHDQYDLFLTLQTNDENEKAKKICSVCNLKGPKCVLSCTDCSFHLCLACATLPSQVKYKYDEHMLFHTIAEDSKNVIGLYWCDICEKKIDEMRSYYKCSDCGPVLHTACAVGSFRNMRLGLSFTSRGQEYQVVRNDRTSQLRCSHCDNDCHEPLLLKSTTTTTDVTSYLCSSTCLGLSLL